MDSPLGGTLPAQVLSTALQKNGVKVRVHEFLAPRLDKHGKKYSIRAAARSFCEDLDKSVDPVIFPDEVVTGTRFIKLFSALSKHLGNRLVPIALQVRNHTTPNLSSEQGARFRDRLIAKKHLMKGAPVHTIFPPAILLKIDDEAPITASSPLYWAEIDWCAGKRKVNFVFGLINEFRHISKALSEKNSEMLSTLCDIWTNSSDGKKIVGHKPFIEKILSKFICLIDWTDIEIKAQDSFPQEYCGITPEVNEAWVKNRFDWILKSVYSQLIPYSSTENGNEAGMVVNALQDLFSYVTQNQRALLPRDRDFCEYTIPYAFPIKVFHDELVQLVLNEMPPAKTGKV